MSKHTEGKVFAVENSAKDFEITLKDDALSQSFATVSENRCLGINHEIQKANAERITKTWNCHDSLLEACFTSCRLCQLMGSNKDCLGCTIGKAIAKAEEE